MDAATRLEHWTPTRPFLRDAALGVRADFWGAPPGKEHSYIDMQSASSDSGRLHAVGCWYAQPHVDLDFPKWSILWVLSTAPHAIWSADCLPRKASGTTRKSRKDAVSAIPLVGDLVVLNTHRLHWVDRPTKRAWFLAALIEREWRPTRDEAEAMMEERAAGVVRCRAMVGGE